MTARNTTTKTQANKPEADPRDVLRDSLLDAALAHIAFDGWTLKSLQAGAEDAGQGSDAALRTFPGGVKDAVAHFVRRTDQRMMAALEQKLLDEMKIRERITCAVRTRLELLENEKEPVRRAVGFLANPAHAALATELTWGTVSAMWYAAGDRSADFNFYTKRMVLTPVYSATLLCWLQDDTEDHAETWAFLDRRIENVMQFMMTKGKLEKRFQGLGDQLKTVGLRGIPNPFRAFRDGLRDAGRWRPGAR